MNILKIGSSIELLFPFNFYSIIINSISFTDIFKGFINFPKGLFIIFSKSNHSLLKYYLVLRLARFYLSPILTSPSLPVISFVLSNLPVPPSCALSCNSYKIVILLYTDLVFIHCYIVLTCNKRFALKDLRTMGQRY